MDFIEDYKKMFDIVADMPTEEDGELHGVMKAVPLDATKEFKNGNGTKATDTYNNPKTEYEFKQVKPKKDTVVTPKVGEMANTKSASDKSDWDKHAETVKTMFNKNISKITGNAKEKSSITSVPETEVKEKFPKISKDPEFLAVRKIQPITTPKESKIRPINNNTVKEGTAKCGSGNDDFDSESKEAVKKFREVIDKMKGMSKYDDPYKDRCAAILNKYSGLPKKQFESICEMMELVNK